MPLPPKLRSGLQPAIDRILETPFEDFKSQVVPYLDPVQQELYETPETWDRMRELVIDRLVELEK
jgi:hypothetical protein